MAKLLGLLDVHPLTERVDVGGGHSVEVTGADLSSVGTNPTAVSPDVLGELIAGCTPPYDIDNGEVVARAKKLPIGTQMKILQAMGRTTFPDGFGPFLEGLRSTSGEVQKAVNLVIREQALTSPPPRPPSAPPATPPSGN